MRVVKLLALFIPLTLISALPAMADNCDPFAGFKCAKSTPDNVHFNGTGTTGQDVNILLGSNTFTVSLVGGAANHFSGDSLIILAAAPNGLTGSLNGVSFTSLGSPGETARRFYYDTLTYSAESLRLVLTTFGDDRVMIGTDYPFSIADMNPHRTIDALGLDENRAYALREGNARRFLGLLA
jgi:hypothetical protein